jgi:hypothetical protein
MPGEPIDEIYVQARRVLLDGLEALGPHREAVILVGAQAIYLHTGDAEFALPAFTRDGDLVLDRGALAGHPLIDTVLKDAGFVLSGQPGTWLDRDGVPLDLLVPEAIAGAGGRRSVQLDPHDRKAARRVIGLEGALVDNTTMRIPPLDARDAREFEVRVAGEAALVVAKCHKVGERLDIGRSVEAKDAFDIFRIVQHASTEGLSRDITLLLQSDVAAEVTARAIEFLGAYFSAEDQQGCRLAQEAVGILDPDGTVAASLAALVEDLLAALAEDGR